MVVYIHIMNDILYVVPCKINNLNSLYYLKKCISSILNFITEEDKILIVDSDSEIKDHFEIYQKNKYIIFKDIKNKNYEAGSLLYAYKNFYFKRYLLIHDSCELKENIKLFKEEAYIYQYVLDPWGKDLIDNFICKTKWAKIPDNFITIVGSIFFLKREILEIFYTNGIENILPSNKIESGVFERIFGIILMQEGYTEQILKNNRLPIFKNYLSRQ